MIYLYETMQLDSATPSHMKQWIEYAREWILPLYTNYNGRLMAAWMCNAQTLFEITQIVEFEDPEKAMALLTKPNKTNSKIDELATMNKIVPIRDRQIYASPNPVFSDAFQQAVQGSSMREKNKFTIAQLEGVHNKLAGLIQRNEGAIASGMPLITTLISITGRQNRVLNIWKGDLNEPGYQPPDFYEAIGFGEDWWTWIRSVAPQEKLHTVSMLPYSPLQ